jgi:dTMP kinase
VDPLAELLLYAADRAQHVNKLLRPALSAGRIVLSDRYAAATAAYQGAGREFSPNLIAQVIELATGGLKPDLTLLFDIAAETSLFRTRHRAANDSQPDRLDSEGLAFHQRVRQGYLAMAQAEAERWRIFDADLAVEEIQAQVRACIADFLVAHGVASPEAFA